MRIFIVGIWMMLFTALPIEAQSQVQDSIFPDRSAMQKYIWETVRDRKFSDLVLRLGGRDEYTTEQLAGVQNQFGQIYPQPFKEAKQVVDKRLENGFRKEIVSFWRGTSYLWLYLFTHEVDGKLVVINFRMNSRPNPVFDLM